MPAPGDSDLVRVMNWPQDRDKAEVEGFPELVQKIGFDMPQKALQANGWQLEPQAKRGLLERIRAEGRPLGQYVEGRFYRGILTGLNNAFVIPGWKKDELIAEHASSAEIIKPFLRGRDIKRWRVEPQDLWLIFVPWHFPLHLDKSVTGASEKAEELFKAGYPAIYRHLDSYKAQLSRATKLKRAYAISGMHFSVGPLSIGKSSSVPRSSFQLSKTKSTTLLISMAFLVTTKRASLSVTVGRSCSRY